MTADSPRHPDSTTYRFFSLRRIVSLCERYEAAWRDGHPPRIEEMLQEVPRPDWPEVLRILVAQDVQIRRERGEQPDSRDYQARFPEWASTIEEVFCWDDGTDTRRPKAPGPHGTIEETVGLPDSAESSSGKGDDPGDHGEPGRDEDWSEGVTPPRFVPIRELDR